MIDAKEFLVRKIVEEAQRAGDSLSEIERKMLYFSETSSTPRDMAEVNQAFDRDYDRAEYEKKVAKLVCKARAHLSSEEARTWDRAVQSLRTGDHYLLAIIDNAAAQERPRGDFLKLLGTAVLIIAIVLLLVYFFPH